MSFSIVHAYVIEALDTHPCQASEYVHDFNDNSDMENDDICHIHHFFHIVYILPDVYVELLHKNFGEKPSSNSKTYEYNSLNNLLKPPINT